MSNPVLERKTAALSGRGVPKIVEAYGEKAFDFKDNRVYCLF